jgi:hypothetical protein
MIISVAAATATLDNDSVETHATSNSHYNEVVAWISQNGLVDKFNNLPPVNEFTFWPIGKLGIRVAATVGVRLFCSEIPGHQTWAIVNAYPSSNKVVLVNQYRSGEVKVVTESSKLALMYPFKDSKGHGNEPFNSIRQIEQLILYLFLCNGHITKMSPKNFDKLRNPASDMGRISNNYEDKGKLDPTCR